MNAWITTQPEPIFEGDPCDHRSEGATAIIQTRHGEFYTARWVVYQDAEYGAFWELCGRDGLQLEADARRRVAADHPLHCGGPLT